MRAFPVELAVNRTFKSEILQTRLNAANFGVGFQIAEEKLDDFAVFADG
jgi:hypothetical protein